MNQNDSDRYVWRTGRRWSGDDWLAAGSFRKLKLGRWAIFLIGLSFIVTLVGLLLR